MGDRDNRSYREVLPLGLMAGGPLIELAGTSGGLVLSGVLTLLLVPIRALAVLGRSDARTRSIRA